jgi:hypothetical protein
MAKLTQEELEVLVVGTSTEPDAVFYEQASLNHKRSQELGSRVYDKIVFIKLTQSGVTDWTAYKAQKADLEAYPEEYQYFLSNKQGDRKPGIEIIPNLDIIHLQELRDFGIQTIQQLAEATAIPPHLAYAQKTAIVLTAVLEETRNGHQEENHEESIESETVPASDRRDNPVDVRQPHLHSSVGSEAGSTPERLPQGGRFNGDKNLNEWEIHATGKVNLH